jgi:hypothetical protein
LRPLPQRLHLRSGVWPDTRRGVEGRLEGAAEEARHGRRRGRLDVLHAGAVRPARRGG